MSSKISFQVEGRERARTKAQPLEKSAGWTETEKQAPIPDSSREQDCARCHQCPAGRETDSRHSKGLGGGHKKR